MTIDDEDDEATGEDSVSDSSVSDSIKPRVDGCSGWKTGSDKMRF